MTWTNTLGSWLAAIALIVAIIVIVVGLIGLGASVPGWLVFVLIGMVALSRLT